MTRRLAQLFAGLVLYGFSIAVMLEAGLGLEPWGVLNEGVTEQTPLSFGLVVCLIGALVLLLWIPLKQKPGIGTVANVIVIGLAVDAAAPIVPDIEGDPLRALFLGLGIFLNGLAGGLYIGAGLGPGPRDGLMTGIARRTGWPLRRVRTGIELTVLAVGWLLGGTVGVGTVLYALAIGPLVQFFLPRLALPPMALKTPALAPAE
ncbi:YczE/YyaS/YitT family protein [Phenylobacterium sp. VNQ135]|uniref:membrane protein YczE n=1 Tax=Phenylobacterium sp. VNQ135 TaxID=3400922 RepID=UPI003C06CE6D